MNQTGWRKRTIMEMAREVGAQRSHNPDLYDIWNISDKNLEAFAALVREDEREVCAKDKQDAERYRHMRNNAQFQSRNGPGLYWYLPRFRDGVVRDEGQQLDDAIDAAIRARGQA